MDDTDCDDTDAAVNPNTVWYKDVDSDGYGDNSITKTQCDEPSTSSDWRMEGGDCDDSDSLINPGAVEICDGEDKDCDFEDDNGVLVTYYRDLDQDSYGNASDSKLDCSGGAGWVEDATDCLDVDADVYPGNTEVCDNGKDNDCDGDADEADSSLDTSSLDLYYIDNDGDSFGDEQDAGAYYCSSPGSGYVTNNWDCLDSEAAANPSEDEVCDEIDNDCDGDVDTDDSNLVADLYYPDGDGDGFGDDGSAGTPFCNSTLGYSVNSLDCDDGDSAVNPNASEVWYDGVDQDCDGESDWDQDGDGYAVLGGDDNGDDCDDTNSNIYPGAPVTLDDEVDDDCDGEFEWTDTDGDGIPDKDEGEEDTDGDGIPDKEDTDSDNDGVPDSVEFGKDADGDGVSDHLDGSSATTKPNQDEKPSNIGCQSVPMGGGSFGVLLALLGLRRQRLE
jgi:hypothetical protein